MPNRRRLLAALVGVGPAVVIGSARARVLSTPPSTVAGFGLAAQRVVHRWFTLDGRTPTMAGLELRRGAEGATVGLPVGSGPLVVVAGLGGAYAGRAACAYAAAWQAQAKGPVSAVVILPLLLESDYRARGLAEAERLVRDLDRVIVIDNQQHLDRLPDDATPTLAELYDQANKEACAALTVLVHA
jgi:hypothetical protein